MELKPHRVNELHGPPNFLSKLYERDRIGALFVWYFTHPTQGTRRVWGETEEGL